LLIWDLAQIQKQRKALMNNTTIEIEDAGTIWDISSLHEQLAQVPDNRKERGLRYSLVIQLLVIILAK
jgi:hypothetical protein